MHSPPFAVTLCPNPRKGQDMNADRLIRMLFNRVLRRSVNKGMNAGIDRMAGDSPEGQQRAKQSKKMARQARQAQRVVRKLGRF